MNFSEIEEQIAGALSKRGVQACPMCGNRHFTILGGFFNNSIQDDLKTFSIGGKGIPTVPIVCSQCGFVSQHALGVLGFLPKKKVKTEDEKNEKKDS